MDDRLTQKAPFAPGHTEQQALLDDWNATGQPSPQHLGIHQLFEAQVARTPDAIALFYQHEQFSYLDLDCRANQLAHLLLEHGIGPECLVALCLERSPDLLIALLAILKTGAAYLPLDPTYPPERLAFMLDDAHASLVLTHQSWLEQHALPETTTLCLETLPGDRDESCPYSFANPHLHLLPENLAYVIYTSGSTGRPKGVAISHRSLLNLLYWHLHTFSPSPSDRASHLAALSFDAATWELWPPLLSGSCLCLLDAHTPLAPSPLQAWLHRYAITLSFLPTPLAEQLLTLDWSQPTSVRTLLVGGDLLHPVPALPLPFALVNNYGPTEHTVVATSGLLTLADRSRLPSIGRPIANTRLYLLDAAGQPVPIGVAGELYLAGQSVARGYLGQPALTAERFLPDPFSAEPGARLYRSGDLARYRADGTLEFLGRADRQVKLRGYRIELGEIEAVLRQHAGVREAVMLLGEQGPADKRLLAYVVLESPPPTPEDLRAYLAGQLPDYMLPAAIIVLESLPLSPNGKLDHRALPAPSRLDLQQHASYIAPRTPLEEVLAGIWAEVLGLEQVGVHDNFFALGGHSLLSTQIAAHVYELLQVELPLRSFFEQPTVAVQAAVLLQNADQRRRIERTAQLLTELALLSENDVQEILEGKALPPEVK
jgi:amino acid adenylation domain-containing protein